MSEGNLLDQQHQQQQKQHHSRKIFCSSRDSELELLDTTTETSSPEIRSRSQSVGSAHREALLFFEQHRLFQNSPDLDFGKEGVCGDCELRSISSTSGTSSPATAYLHHHHHHHHQQHQHFQDQSLEKSKPNYQQRQQKPGNSNLLCHQQQVQHRHKKSGLRQQSDSNLLESSGSSLAAASFLTGAANGGNQTNSFNDAHSSATSSGDGGVRARSQSQGQCGSVRRRQDSCSSVIVTNTNSKKNGGESGGGGDGTRKASKWLEEIQFTAQYQHYRTNNYASVVSSASSLDKSDGGTGSSGTAALDPCAVGVGDQTKYAGYTAVLSTSGAQSKKKNASEAERPSSSKPGGVGSGGSSSSISRHRHHSHQFTKSCNQQQEQEVEEEETGKELQHHHHQQHEHKQQENQGECINSDNLNRQNSVSTKQCWNFPRVKLKKLFTAKSLDDILGGGRSRSASGSSRSGLLQGRKKSLQVATGVSSSSTAQEEFSQEEVSGERSSSSPEFVVRHTHTKKAQLLRDNKLSLPRFQQHDDKAHLLIIKPAQDGSKSPGAHSSKSAIVVSSTASSKQRKGPVFIKATRQKSRSFSALTSALLSRVPGHSSSGANSPCSSTTSSATASGLSVFFKRSHQDNKNTPPVVPPKKSGHVVPCAKSDNCLNKIVASATCAKFVDYFSAESSKVSKSAASSTPVEPYLQQQSSSSEHFPPGSSSAASSSSAIGVVVSQPRKWTAIKNKWDQKLQASGDRQKEIGASLASVSNNAQIFRKAHHHHQPRQRSNSLSPLDNPEDGKSIESLLEITSPSPTLQEVRFLDTPEIRYASPIAVRSSYGDYSNLDDDEDDDDNNEDESVTLTEGIASNITNSTDIVAERDSRTPSRASSACSTYTVSSFCSECKENEDNLEDEETDTVGEMTRHHGNKVATGVGGKKRSRDHHHHHRHEKLSSKEKPKLVVANVTYLQRPMSPGLVLRESSPSSTVSGTIDSFGNLTGGTGNLSGVTRGGSEPAGNLYSPSVIQNNNVFTNNNNQPSSQSKSQQAKLEFLKSFSASQTYDQQQQQPSVMSGPDRSRRRDPLCANNTSIVNANERQPSSGAVGLGFISPSSSSGGASDNRSGSSVGIGKIGTNNPEGGRTNVRSSHQPYSLGDLQDSFHTNRQRDHFISDAGDRLPGGSGSGDATRGYGANNSNTSSSRGAPSDGGIIGEQQRSSQTPRQQRGAEHCSNKDRNQSFVIDSDRHQSNQGATGSGAGQGDPRTTMTAYGSRSTDSQSSAAAGRDTGNPPGDSAGGRGSSAPINQGGPQTLAQQQSSINNNLLIDVDFDGTDDTMGDLQSPQYVKRTAHMFDSRFSSGEADANGHDRRNPSYLNVSRSVSGYSCLTYNNGSVTSETVASKSVLGNGASLLTSATRVTTAAPRLKTDFSIHSPFSRNKVPNTDDDSSDHSSNQSATSPPPSLPPINTTSSHARYSDSPFFQNGVNRDDLIDDTPYIPSHGKSFIMQRIERLYGSDAVSSNKGVLARKSSHVTTISITRESPTRGTERIIPIKVESRDDHQNNLYNSARTSNKNDNSDEGTVCSDVSTTSVIIPIIRSSENSRISIVSTEETDEEEDDRSAAKRRSPTKSMGHLNGNANRYRNDEDRATNGNETASTNGPSGTLGKIIHANGNNRHHDEDCIPAPLKTTLSRESSTGSDDTNEFSENSIELGSISSDVDSGKTVVNRQDSKEDSLYSNRGASSPLKPKPKPKPKDMALLRTLSRSPALKTGTENFDKTAISSSYSIVQPDAVTAVAVSKLDDRIETSPSEDQVDAGGFSALSDIKNTISAATANSLPQGKATPPPATDNTSHSSATVDKENTVSRVAENDKVQQNVEKAVPTTSTVKDGNYFLNEMRNVTVEILKLSDKAAKELDSIDESEDRAGSIHAAIGKGNLLVKKKFKQFEELCNANLKGSTGDEPETTNEDLAGFWDMVMIQVEQIYFIFADLEKNQSPLQFVPVTPLKTSSPKRMPASTSKPSTRTSVGVTPKANSAAAKARDEARRKLLAEKRKAMKNQMQDTQETPVVEPEAEVQIFAPENPHTG